MGWWMKSPPTEQSQAVEDYANTLRAKSDLERTELAKEKTGVFTGAYAINPVNGEKIPIWIADYVLASYGTGAIMAVPAHDTRDFEFATKFNLPIVQVVQPPRSENGLARVCGRWHVGEFRLSSPACRPPEAKKKITAWLEAKGLGKKTVNYKLRDWLFSRQRYWGEPFPIVWKRTPPGICITRRCRNRLCRSCRPTLDDYKPTADGQPPLARAKDWVKMPERPSAKPTRCRNGPAVAGIIFVTSMRKNPARSSAKMRSVIGWAASHVSPASRQRLRQPSTPGVDLYVGGTEHAVLHLLYARFWHKVLFDLGHVSTPEPFFKLVNQGLILGEDGQKMSKSRGNVVNPDDILEGIRRGRLPPLRNVHGPARNGETVEHKRRRGRLPFPRPGLAVVRG